MKIIILMLLASTAATSKTPGIEYGLHFDDRGNIIRPDEVFLLRGLDHDKDGYKKEAMKNLKIAASYGNANARYFTALLYLQEKDYINGHAWLSLLNSDYIGVEKVKELLPKVEANLTNKELAKAKEKLKTIKKEYGDYAGLLKREKWRKSLKFTGTHIKGYIPPFLTISSGNASITGTNLRKQMNTFVYEYDDQFKFGEVKLKDVEYIDKETEAEK